MPYTQKHTWFFQGAAKGWTETLYLRNVSPTTAAGLVIAQQIAAARAAMLGAGIQIHAIRIQEVENAAGAPVERVGDNYQNQIYPGPASPQGAHPDISLLADCISPGDRKHKVIYLGGIWRTIVDNFGQYTPSAAWTDAFTNWATKVVNFGYGWRARTPSPKVQITNYTVDDNGFVTITTSGTPFSLFGDEPFLANIRKLPTIGKLSPLNGERLLVKLGNNTAKTVESFGLLPFAGVGFLNTFTYGFETIAGIGPEKVVSRERGAPLLQSPGRRSG